ncbi:hypothetical protein [Sulfurimonas sp.]|jgi:DNA primase|uniref:hypothetical protein n=1 Tax=Sulfurimonas sp. TaxID=2022749 RepID=UPI0025F32EDD|nr:hypothetical protein [Sulfurimonas sp.]MBT5934544.1 hypothetical protein [Sulfurimonas sp.]
MQSNLLTLIKEIKCQLTKEDVIRILSYIGYEFNRSGKFRLRAEESTPSASVTRDGNIKDFGSGWYGDIFALLHDYYDYSIVDAAKYVADCVGVDYE